MYVRIIIAFLLAITVSETPNQQSTHEIRNESDTLLIQNANIINMDSEGVLRDMDILITDGVIIEIAPFIKPDKEMRVIKGKGKYVMPALFDMHAHIGEENPFLEYQLGLYRYFGVHHVNLMVSNDKIKTIKESIGGNFNNDLKIPNLYLASELVDGDPPLWGEDHNGPILVDVKKVEETLKELQTKGYKDIKVYNQLSEDVYLEILDSADRLGLRVVGHVPFSLSLEKRLDERQQRVDHLDGFGELAYDGDLSELPGMGMERLNMLVDNFYNDKFHSIAEETARKNIWVVPTHVLYSALLDQNYVYEIMKGEYSEWLDPTLAGWWAAIVNDENQMPHIRSEKFRDIHLEMISSLHKKGVRMMAGTDAPMPLLMYGRSLHKELELFLKAGLTPFEAIKTATVHPAEYLGLKDMGKIKEGYQAELIFLDENPLEDIENTLSISGYFSNNKYVPKADMEEYLKNLIE